MADDTPADDPLADEPLAFAYKHCEQLIRDADEDRFLAAQFAPADKRPHLFALYAFSHEIARVRDSVREAMIGEIRLQWWRDALQGEARGDVKANPIAAALDDTIVKFRLPRQALVDLIDARVFDLYDDPMPSVNDLEGYCGETSSSLIRLASIILPKGQDAGSADAAGHAGVAYALAGLLRAFPWHARRGQVYVPAEILARHGVVRDDIVSGRGGPGLMGALADMRAIARWHLEQVRGLRSTISPEAAPAFRSLAAGGALSPGGWSEPITIRSTPRSNVAKWRKIWALWRGLTARGMDGSARKQFTPAQCFPDPCPFSNTVARVNALQACEVGHAWPTCRERGRDMIFGWKRAALVLAALIGGASGAQADRIKNPTAVFSGLDKITGRIVSFEVGIDETVQFGALRMQSRVCFTKPPNENPNTTSFVEVEETGTDGKSRKVFSGWMFASSPGLHGIEHPVYDIWLVDCKGGKEIIPEPKEAAEELPPIERDAPADATEASRSRRHHSPGTGAESLPHRRRSRPRRCARRLRREPRAARHQQRARQRR